MKHCITISIATLLLLSSLFFTSPDNDKTYCRFNSFYKTNNYTIIDCNKYNINSNYSSINYRDYHKNIINFTEPYSYNILPTINSNIYAYNICCDKNLYKSYQPIYADNIVIKYTEVINPFEHKTNNNCDLFVETGIQNRVDFNNPNDLPNNPSSVPIGDNVLPFLLCLLEEVNVIHNKKI